MRFWCFMNWWNKCTGTVVPVFQISSHGTAAGMITCTLSVPVKLHFGLTRAKRKNVWFLNMETSVSTPDSLLCFNSRLVCQCVHALHETNVSLEAAPATFSTEYFRRYAWCSYSICNPKGAHPSPIFSNWLDMKHKLATLQLELIRNILVFSVSKAGWPLFVCLTCSKDQI